MHPTEHEPLIGLVRDHPRSALLPLLPEIQVPPGPIAALAADATTVTPTERRADLVLRFGTPQTGQMVIVEVQSQRDESKSWTWPAYLATLRDRHRTPAALVVLTLDPTVERWAERKVELGHPGLALRPIVIGPKRIPDDPTKVEGDPYLSVLSVLCHGRGPRGEALAIAALDALQTVDEADRREYAPAIVRSVDLPVRTLLEKLMTTQESYKGTFFETWLDQGRQEGRQEGWETMVHTIGTLLAQRFPNERWDDLREVLKDASLEQLSVATTRVFQVADAAGFRSELQTLIAGH